MCFARRLITKVKSQEKDHVDPRDIKADPDFQVLLSVDRSIETDLFK